MEEDDIKEPEEQEPPLDEGIIYETLSSVETQRASPVDDELFKEGGEGQSLGRRMRESPKLTDMQTADKRLFPDLGYGHLNNIQVSRVFPDVYNPLARILVKDLIRNSNDDMRVAEAIATVNTSVSIAIDGEGRIDELGLAGVSHEENLEKEKSKNLGL